MPSHWPLRLAFMGCSFLVRAMGRNAEKGQGIGAVLVDLS